MAQARKRKNGNGHDVQARIQALRADFDALQSDMQNLMSHVGEAATDGAAQVANQAEQWAGERVDGVRGAIREQPITAIALSMGAGAIIGTLLRR